MTEKQIIIDVCPYQGECSVSGCKRNDDSCFVRQLFEERNRAENRIVELNKTIQAKEQECERWKSNFNGKVSAIEELLKQLDQLKAENDLFRTCHDNEQAKRRKYGQAIEDIKEIAKKTLNMVDYKTYFKRNNKSLKQEGFKALNEILQKISEVEDE